LLPNGDFLNKFLGSPLLKKKKELGVLRKLILFMTGLVFRKSQDFQKIPHIGLKENYARASPRRHIWLQLPAFTPKRKSKREIRKM
jgi:hypothetical protein